MHVEVQKFFCSPKVRPHCVLASAFCSLLASSYPHNLLQTHHDCAHTHPRPVWYVFSALPSFFPDPFFFSLLFICSRPLRRPTCMAMHFMPVPMPPTLPFPPMSSPSPCLPHLTTTVPHLHVGPWPCPRPRLLGRMFFPHAPRNGLPACTSRRFPRMHLAGLPTCTSLPVALPRHFNTMQM